MTYKFISWNIDSLNAALTGTSNRAELSQNVINMIADQAPDIFSIQETKLSDDEKKVNKVLTLLAEHFPDYKIVHRISTPPARKGYAGTMMLYKTSLPEPLVTFPEIDAPDTMDFEGRMITLEFPDFYVTTVYTPNAQEGLKRLSERGLWDDHYRSYLQELDKNKPVLASGDFNVAHTKYDLSNPTGNRSAAGFTPEECAKFDQLLKAGFTDSFRHLHPIAVPENERDFSTDKIEQDYKDKVGFYQEGKSTWTWFAQRARTAKTNNSGWRIDYWLTSDRLAEKIIASHPLDSGARLDHLPILLEINL